VAIEWLDAVCASYSDLQEKESNDSHVVVRCSTKRKASWVLWALRQYLQERRAAFKSLKHYAHYSEDVFRIDPRSQLFSIVVHIELLACAAAMKLRKAVEDSGLGCCAIVGAREPEEESFWMAGFWMHQVQMIGETLLQTIYWKTDLDPDARWDEKAFKGAIGGLQRGYRRPSKGL